MANDFGVLIAVDSPDISSKIVGVVEEMMPNAAVRKAAMTTPLDSQVTASTDQAAFIDFQLWVSMDESARVRIATDIGGPVVIVIPSGEIDRPAVPFADNVEYIPAQELSAMVIRLLLRDSFQRSQAARKGLEARRLVEEQIRIAAQRESAFVTDVLSSVTGGKLKLCHRNEDMPARRGVSEMRVVLTPCGGIRELRRATVAACNSVGMPTSRTDDFETAVGEAAMNAVVHAGSGVAEIIADAECGLVQLWVRDEGAGISIERLPHATLRRGYSSAGTLGHGFKMILKTVDSVYLLTSSRGTTIVLEQGASTPDIESMWG